MRRTGQFSRAGVGSPGRPRRQGQQAGSERPIEDELGQICGHEGMHRTVNGAAPPGALVPRASAASASAPGPSFVATARAGTEASTKLVSLGRAGSPTRSSPSRSARIFAQLSDAHSRRGLPRSLRGPHPGAERASEAGRRRRVRAPADVRPDLRPRRLPVGFAGGFEAAPRRITLRGRRAQITQRLGLHDPATALRAIRASNVTNRPCRSTASASR